jgi:hypothetical protein
LATEPEDDAAHSGAAQEPAVRSKLDRADRRGRADTDQFVRTAERITSAGLRIDREWTEGFFTFVAAEAQWIEDWEADSLEFAGGSGDDAFAATAQIGTDIRIGRQSGLALRYAYNESENRDDAYSGNDLPYVPKQTGSATFYHASARMWEAELGLIWEGERAADLGNSVDLDGRLFANTVIRWQPDDRHWDIALTATKLLTSGYESISGSDFATSFSVERRW